MPEVNAGMTSGRSVDRLWTPWSVPSALVPSSEAVDILALMYVARIVILESVEVVKRSGRRNYEKCSTGIVENLIIVLYFVRLFDDFSWNRKCLHYRISNLLIGDTKNLVK